MPNNRTTSIATNLSLYIIIAGMVATLITPLVYAIFGVHPLSTLTYCLFTALVVSLTRQVDWLLGFIIYYILVIQVVLSFIPFKGLEGAERVAAPVFICATAAVTYLVCLCVRRVYQFLRKSGSRQISNNC